MYDLVRLGPGLLVRLFRSRESLLIKGLVFRQQPAVFKLKNSRPRLVAMDKPLGVDVATLARNRGRLEEVGHFSLEEIGFVIRSLSKM